MNARRLTAAERAALGNLCDAVDCDRVRLHRRPPDAIRAIVLLISRGRAVALGNHVYLPDAADGPALLAHELTHCGQYQSWGGLLYYGRGIADRLRDVLHLAGLSESPYRYVVDDRPFDAYGMEQQGQIVEDCFNGNAAARTLSPYRPEHQT